MVTVVDADDARGVKKRMVHGADVFERARDFYHAHEDLRSEAIQVTDPLGTPLYALRFRHNRIEGVPQNMQLSTYVRPFWHYGEDAPRMDFTYLEAHDAFLFLEVEEYSCFLATLIGHRYPEKPVAFSDRRASLFFEDVEIAETTDEFLAAHPSLVAERVLTVNGGLTLRGFMSTDTQTPSCAVMTSVFWASEETSFGPQNPDKVFYLMRTEIGESGLAKLVEYTIGIFDLALKKRADVGCDFIPVMDTGLPGDVNQFATYDGQDVWQLFFEPINAYPLEEVYDSAHVIVSGEGSVALNPYRMALKRQPDVSSLISRYVRLNERCRSYCERMYEEVVPKGARRVLGVVGRGTDFNNPKITRMRHRPLAPLDLLAKTRRTCLEGDFDTVFLATEDRRVLDCFLASDIAGRLCYVEQPRYDLSHADDRDKLLIDVYREQEAQGQRDGLDRSMRYLSALYILSKADALIASTQCGASIFALGFKEGAFESVYIDGIS